MQLKILVKEMLLLVEEAAWSRANSGAEKGHKQATLCVLTKGKFLYSGAADATVRKYSVQSGVLVTTLRHHKGEVVGLVANSDGAVISASADGTARVLGFLFGEVGLGLG